MGGFSPRVRGCSFGCDSGHVLGPVFPACAGMFHSRLPEALARLSFPRVCGDVPALDPQNVKSEWFSPRVRGCS